MPQVLEHCCMQAHIGQQPEMPQRGQLDIGGSGQVAAAGDVRVEAAVDGDDPRIHAQVGRELEHPLVIGGQGPQGPDRSIARIARTGERSTDGDHPIDPVTLQGGGHEVLADQAALAVRHQHRTVQVLLGQIAGNCLGHLRYGAVVEAELGDHMHWVAGLVQRLGQREHEFPGFPDSRNQDHRFGRRVAARAQLVGRRAWQQ